MTLSIYDQYWIVLNHNPATEVYKSAAFGFVANNTASYQTWLTGGDFGSRYPVIDAVDNGGGLIRLTLTTTTNLVTGMRFLVRGVLGTTEANGFWQITVIDATHVDLVGTTFVHAFVPYPDPTLTGIGLSADMVGGTIIDTFDNLYASLDVNAHRYWDGLNTPRVLVIDVGPGNFTLSNPPPQFIIVTNTTATAGRKVFLPRFDTPKSMPIGQEIVFLAFALNTPVFIRDYTNSFDFFDMNGGEVWGITSQGNTIDTGFGNSRITRNPYIATTRFTGAHKIAGNDSATPNNPTQELDVTGGVEFTGAGGIQRSALTGDVTASAGSNATTIANNAVTTTKIANDAVTYAKIQNVSATDRLLMRDTAGAGDIEEGTVGGGIEFTGGPGIQTSAFTGDVTKSAGGTALTIANDAVTYAKIQNVADGVNLGRATGAGSGDMTELTAQQSAKNSNGKAAFYAHKNGTDQTGIAPATLTAITFGTEAFDIGGFFASDKWTPPAGKVWLHAQVTITVNTVDANMYQIYIYKDGALLHSGPVVHCSGAGNFLGCTVTCIDDASGSNAYEVKCVFQGAGNKTVGGSNQDTFFMGYFI